MSKKIFAFIAAIAIIFCLNGCTVKINENSKVSGTSSLQNSSEKPTEATVNTPVIGDIDDYVGVYTKKSLDYTDGVGNHYTPTYTVPKLLISGDDCEGINDEIQNKCIEFIEDSEESEKKKTSLFCIGIKYETYLNDEVLTLIVEIDNDWAQVYYMIYSVDVLTGKELDKEDIAHKMGTSEKDLNLRIKNTMLDRFLEISSSLSGDSYYKTQLNNTVSEENIDRAAVYYGKDGDIYIHCFIYTMAGAEKYEYLLPLK